MRSQHLDTTTETTEPTPEPPLLNGRYKLLRAIGQGGMGMVYLAEHVRLDTIVAVKEVRPEDGGEEEIETALAQCEREARTLVKLSHPNLPVVKDAFVENGRFYLVMEFIEGVTLEAKLKEAGNRPLDTALVVDWGLQIADVLAYLHAQEPPIIFRDMKPANVMVQPDGNIRLIDFGIARRFQPGATKDTALLGSVGYSPPEQFGRHQTDTRSDIYAFGATLHHLLTGLDPAASPFKFKPVTDINYGVPEPLSQLIAHCVMLDADARPQDIHTVALQLLSVKDLLAAPTLSPGGAYAAQDIINPLLELDTVPPGSPSGPPPPRIISTKLAEAEAQKRKTGSRDRSESPSGVMPAPTASGRIPAPIGVSGVPSGSVSPSGGMSPVGPPPMLPPNAAPPIRPVSVPMGSRRAAWIPLAASLTVVLVFVGVFAFNALRPGTPKVPPGKPPKNGNPGASGPILAPASDPSALAAPSMQPPGSEAPPPVSADQAAIVDAEIQSVETDANNVRTVHIAANGHVPNAGNAPILLAAFFYDGDDQPILAADPHSIYANAEGQASIAHSLSPGSQGEFSTQLAMPLSAFPPKALDRQVKVRCVVFVNNQRAGETLMLPVTNSLSTPNGGTGGNAAPNNDNSPTLNPENGGNSTNGRNPTRGIRG